MEPNVADEPHMIDGLAPSSSTDSKEALKMDTPTQIEVTAPSERSDEDRLGSHTRSLQPADASTAAKMNKNKDENNTNDRTGAMNRTNRNNSESKLSPSKRPGPEQIRSPPTRATSFDPRRLMDRRSQFSSSNNNTSFVRRSDTGLVQMRAPSRVGSNNSIINVPPMLIEGERENSSSSLLVPTPAPTHSEMQKNSSAEPNAIGQATQEAMASDESGTEPHAIPHHRQSSQLEDAPEHDFDINTGAYAQMGYQDAELSEDFVFQENFPSPDLEAGAAGVQPRGSRRTPSFINSLPVVDAQLEQRRHNSIVAVATDVVPIDIEALPAEETYSPSPPVPIHPLLQKRTRPALISVHILKQTKDTPIGLVLENVDDHLYVQRINPSGVLDRSPLGAGHKILSLDGTPCVNWTGEKAMQYISDAVGSISILAENPINGRYHLAEACVCKANPSDKVGLNFHSEANKLYISSISTSGLIGSRSVLNVGDQVISINDEECIDLDPRLAKRLVREAPNIVSILVSTMNTIEVSTRNFISRRLSSNRGIETPQVFATEVRSSSHFGEVSTSGPQVQPAHISVVVFKPGVHTNLGLELGNVGEKLVITKVLNSGLFATSPLKEGHEVLSINSQRCASWKSGKAMEVLGQTMGRISIIVMNPLGDDRYVEAMVMKMLPRVKIGLGFRSSRNQLKIGTVNPGGLLADSVLNAGDTIVSINNVPCGHFSASQASAMAKRFTSVVTILTKTQHSSGVVVSEINVSRRSSLLGIPVAFARTPAGSSRDSDRSNSKLKYYLIALAIVFAAFIIVFGM